MLYTNGTDKNVFVSVSAKQVNSLYFVTRGLTLARLRSAASVCRPNDNINDNNNQNSRHRSIYSSAEYQ